MIFDIQNSTPIFSQEQIDELVFKRRMRRLEKRMNEFAASLSKEESFLLLNWLKERTLFCERCNIQFYSNSGLVNHKCGEKR